MPYTARNPQTPPMSEELRARIPGWGADLNPHDRPSVPKERFDLEGNGAHWDFPERQPEKWPREKSIEHAMLTPVFGTSTPPKRLSGVIRKYAYRKYSEGRAAHWVILLGADRIDALESHVRSLASLRPDNPLTQTGIRTELTHRGYTSRFRSKRADVNHHWIDPIIVGGPWLVAGYYTARIIRRVRTRL